ncbi:uncharacterized protein LOC122393439 [Amphibalanus amphitrite]|uniref:uncharacterized protein LOC122393439 n=1 Tax=Amphibalanus amphitrite TaxID=1232801 RepID=UPI001C906A7B|nr:uncharacterized protein LOC122393439 [Amphibalanus amphitrite]
MALSALILCCACLAGASVPPAIEDVTPPSTEAEGDTFSANQTESQLKSLTPRTPEACVVLYTETGDLIEEGCVDISEQCNETSCAPGTVCGLNLDQEVECFDESAIDIQNCESAESRLARPCPEHTEILGFGMGCTFCVEDALLDHGDRACIVIPMDIGEEKQECVDISERCAELSCENETVCGLNLNEIPQCFPSNVTELQTCESEQDRLNEPCPYGTSVQGFGQGCTFCKVDEPDEMRVCFLDPSELMIECVDISKECELLDCELPGMCVLNLNKTPECLRNSSDLYENCDTEEFRLAQPCPIDFSIVGFGEICTYCSSSSDGPEPTAPTSVSPSVIIPTTMAPLSARSSPSFTCYIGVYQGKLTFPCKDFSATCRRCSRRGKICVRNMYQEMKCVTKQDLEQYHAVCGSRRKREFRRCPDDFEPAGYSAGCTYCWQLSPKRVCRVTDGQARCSPLPRWCQNCPDSTTCVLDTDGRAWCATFQILSHYSSSPKTEQVRLLVPCPPGQVAEAFGAGRNYCRPRVGPRACLVSRHGGRCQDIGRLCQRQGCGRTQTCVVGTDEKVRCVDPNVLQMLYRKNCGSELQGLLRPCADGGAVEAFGQRCTYCRPRPTRPAVAKKRACFPNRAGPMCVDISVACMRMGCSAISKGTSKLCVRDSNTANVKCVDPRVLRQHKKHCGSELERLTSPCPRGSVPALFGAGCNYCSVCIAIINGQCVTVDMIEKGCGRIHCRRGTQCVLQRFSGTFSCKSMARRIPACGTPSERKDKPCTRRFSFKAPLAFGVNCNYC